MAEVDEEQVIEEERVRRQFRRQRLRQSLDSAVATILSNVQLGRFGKGN